jgi:hypothetical protein
MPQVAPFIKRPASGSFPLARECPGHPANWRIADPCARNLLPAVCQVLAHRCSSACRMWFVRLKSFQTTTYLRETVQYGGRDRLAWRCCGSTDKRPGATQPCTHQTVPPASPNEGYTLGHTSVCKRHGGVACSRHSAASCASARAASLATERWSALGRHARSLCWLHAIV